MRSGCVLVAAVLCAGCPKKSEGPLPAEQVAAYGACNEVAECTLAKNEPLSCCGAVGFDNWVAIARARADAFRAQFEPPECSGAYDCVPSVPDDVLKDRFVLGCTNGQCAITETHEHSGEACSAETPCPDQYACASVCVFHPEAPTCEVGAPAAADRPSDPAIADLGHCREGWDRISGPGGGAYCNPWYNCVERTCGEAGADFPDAMMCEQIHEACGVDQFPSDLPNDGTVIIRVPSGGSIADAIASAPPGAIIAISTGAYAEALELIGEVTLWGCGESTELAGEIRVRSPNARIRNLIVRGAGVVQDTGSQLKLERVLISGSGGAGWSLAAGASGTGEMVIVRAAGGDGVDVDSASLLLRHTALDGNHSSGLVASGTSTVSLEDVVASRNERGSGVVARAGARIQALGVVLEENRSVGLDAEGGAIDAGQVFITTTGLLEPDARGYGALAIDGGNLVLSRAYFERNRNGSAVASGLGSELTVIDTVVESTLFASDQRIGAGLIAEGGAIVDGTRMILAHSKGRAIAVSGAATTAVLRAVIIEFVEPGSGSAAAIGASGGARLVLDQARISDVTGLGAIAGGVGTKLELFGVRFEDLTDVGLEASAEARIEVTIGAVSRAVGAGVHLRDPNTSAKLLSFAVDQISAYKETGPGGFGVVVDSGARAELERVELADTRHAGVWISGEACRAVARDLLIDRTGSDCAAVLDGAALALERFEVRSCAVAGIAADAGSMLTLAEGKIAASGVGLGLPSGSESPLPPGVCFEENAQDVDTSGASVPAAIDLDGVFPLR